MYHRETRNPTLPSVSPGARLKSSRKTPALPQSQRPPRRKPRRLVSSVLLYIIPIPLPLFQPLAPVMPVALADGLGEIVPGLVMAVHSRQLPPVPVIPGWTVGDCTVPDVHSQTLPARSHITSPLVRVRVRRW